MSNAESVEKQPLIKWGWLRAILFFLSGFGVMVLVRIAKKAFVYGNESLDTYEALVLSQLITFTGFLLLVIAFRKLVDRKSIVSLGFRLNKSFLRDLLLGLTVGAGMAMLIFFLLIRTESVAVSNAPAFSGYHFLLFIVLFIVVALHEEIVWRGYFLSNFMASMNKYLALVVPTLVFALLHADSPTVTTIGLVNVVLAGLMFGVYYVHKQNLWFPIALHFAWNFMLGPVFGSAVSGNAVPSVLQIELIGNPLLTGGEYGFEGSLLTTFFFAIVTLVIHLNLRQRSAAK